MLKVFFNVMDLFAVFCHEYGYTNHYVGRMEVADWQHVVVFLKYFLMGFKSALRQFRRRYFSMNLNENLHQC